MENRPHYLSRGDPRRTLVYESAEVRLLMQVLPESVEFSEENVRLLNGGRS